MLALEIDIRIPYATLSKDERQVLWSLLHTARSRMRPWVAEVGDGDSKQRAVLGFPAGSSSAAEVEQRIDRVEVLTW